MSVPHHPSLYVSRKWVREGRGGDLPASVAVIPRQERRSHTPLVPPTWGLLPLVSLLVGGASTWGRGSSWEVLKGSLSPFLL